MSETPEPSQGRPAAFGFIFVSAVACAMTIGIMVPVLPNLLKQFNGGDTASAADWSVTFFVFGGLMSFFAGPILGLLSDRFGRRPVLLMSISGLGLDFLFMAFAPSIGWLFVGRLISGMTSGVFSTANAYVADVTPPEKRARAFGWMGAAFSIGFLAGPALGGFLGDINLRLPFLVAAGLTLVNALYGLFRRPGSRCRRANAPRRFIGGGPTRLARCACCVRITNCCRWRASASSTNSPTWCGRASSCFTPVSAFTGRRD